MGLPVAASQRRRVLSLEPETMQRPSGLKATELIMPVCPFRGEPMGLPVAASQSRREVSTEPETMRCPSGLKATDQTLSVCPCSRLLSWVTCTAFSSAVWPATATSATCWLAGSRAMARIMPSAASTVGSRPETRAICSRNRASLV